MLPWFVNMIQVLFAGNLLLIAFVSYFGGKLHRPKIIALGCTVLSFGCLLISLPHFLIGRWVFWCIGSMWQGSGSREAAQQQLGEKIWENVETKCQRLTATSTPCSPVLVRGGSERGWMGRKVFYFAFSSHCFSLLAIGNQWHLPPLRWVCSAHDGNALSVSQPTACTAYFLPLTLWGGRVTAQHGEA